MSSVRLLIRTRLISEAISGLPRVIIRPFGLGPERVCLPLYAAAYPGFSAQQRSQCSTRISAGAEVGRGSLK